MTLLASAARTSLKDAVIQSALEIEALDGLLQGTALQKYAEEKVKQDADRGMGELRNRLADELPSSKENRNSNRLLYAGDATSPLIDELGLIAEFLLYDIIGGDVHEITDNLHQAVADILQAGVTTTYAVALLLQHGYVVDADARWRGLYELTCQAAVMAKTQDCYDAALRYLVHGGRIPELDARAQPVLQLEQIRGADPSGRLYFWKDYQWIPSAYFSGNAPKRITQTDLFDYADLQSAPRDLVNQSHKSVHMSSLVVATSKNTAQGAMPGGYDPALKEEITERLARTLYELVAHCCVLAAKIEFPPRTVDYLAWERTFWEHTHHVIQKLNL